MSRAAPIGSPGYRKLNPALFPPPPAAAPPPLGVKSLTPVIGPAAAEGLKTQPMAFSGAFSMTAEGHWRLTLPYPPSANNYWRTIVITDKQTKKPRALTLVSEEARKYKKEIKMLGGLMPLLLGPIGMRVWVYRPMRRGDLGNRIKVLEDALEGVVYENDDQIEYEELFRHDDKTNPRVEVEVWCLPTERQGEFPP